MKTTGKIARECGIEPMKVIHVVNKNGIEGVKANPLKNHLYFTVDQEVKIKQILFFEYRFEFEYLESKMNKN